MRSERNVVVRDALIYGRGKLGSSDQGLIRIVVPTTFS